MRSHTVACQNNFTEERLIIPQRFEPRMAEEMLTQTQKHCFSPWLIQNTSYHIISRSSHVARTSDTSYILHAQVHIARTHTAALARLSCVKVLLLMMSALSVLCCCFIYTLLSHKKLLTNRHFIWQRPFVSKWIIICVKLISQLLTHHQQSPSKSSKSKMFGWEKAEKPEINYTVCRFTAFCVVTVVSKLSTNAAQIIWPHCKLWACFRPACESSTDTHAFSLPCLLVCVCLLHCKLYLFWT